MALTTGSFVGPYEILAKLGEGGMGEVYRARDTKLNRQVALKVLPASVAADTDRLRRLQREAQLLASLNHPQIATVHGLEESNSGLALVMELIDGDDLRQRLSRGPIPVADALPIARQIALALEAAHGQGIVHRDLKPANIKVRADGAVKVLDFGLAKADPGSKDPGLRGEDTPTVTSPAALTVQGAVMGTAAYMSPEQARGQMADKRSDIFAFGGVLYEMLTGSMAFPGATISDTLAAVLRGDPDWSKLPADTPPAISRLLRRCLEKDPARRMHDIADARIEIEDAANGDTAGVTSTPSRARRRSALPTVVAVAAVIAAAAAAWFLKPAPELPEMRVNISTEPSTDSAFALSPDGTKVVYVASVDGPMRLWVRSLDQTAGHPLPGTERATLPFWSPDGKSISFFSDSRLKRVDIDGGLVKTLVTEVAVPLGGTWGADGTILYNGDPGGPIRRVSADGGAVGTVTRVDPPERGHFWPYFLPGARRFLFYMSGPPETSGLFVADLEGHKTRLFAATAGGVYVEPGYIVFPRGKQILAQRFDAESATLSGEVMTLAEVNASPRLSATTAGTIAYRTSTGDSGQRELLWLDRTGKSLERVVYGGFAAQGPAISHDGRYVAVFRFLNGNMDLWTYDRQRAFWDRFTVAPGDDIFPVFSPDDRSLIYAGVRNPHPIKAYQRVIGAPPSSEQPLTTGSVNEFSMDVSPDGRHLLLTRAIPGRGADILAVRLGGAASEACEIVATEHNEGLPVFSPDGKWIAYESDKTGTDEVFIRPFPGPGQDIRISTDGGNQARWNPKTSELYYVNADDWLMAVRLTFKPDGTADPGRPEKLFRTNIGSTVRLKYRQQYVVDPGGKSFMINAAVDAPIALPIVLILNWKPAR